MDTTSTEQIVNAKPKPGRWKRRAKWAGLAALSLVVVLAWIVKDHVRTLVSLRKVTGANAYVMDYYADYHLNEIRERGIDVGNIEDSCLETLLPDIVLPIARSLKRYYIPNPIAALNDRGHHCSTVAIQSKSGDVFFGRNFDYHHDACLILRVHDDEGVSTVSVIDLAFLNLNQTDLDQTNLIQRIPLLFAPYYVQDGMNRDGLAISDMSVSLAEPPRDAGQPDIIHSTLMRLILDYAHTTDEAVAIIRQFNVHFVETPIHLMVADSSGRSLIVEFIDGEIELTPSQQPWQVCTNQIMRQHTESENDAACRRYRTASGAADALDRQADADDVMRIMQSVSSDGGTMWSSVYNLTKGDYRVAYKAKTDAEYRDSIGKN